MIAVRDKLLLATKNCQDSVFAQRNIHKSTSQPKTKIIYSQKMHVFRRHHVLGDPVNFVDPTGMATSCLRLPTGGAVCFDNSGKLPYGGMLPWDPEHCGAIVCNYPDDNPPLMYPNPNPNPVPPIASYPPSSGSPVCQ